MQLRLWTARERLHQDGVYSDSDMPFRSVSFETPEEGALIMSYLDNIFETPSSPRSSGEADCGLAIRIRSSRTTALATASWQQTRRGGDLRGVSPEQFVQRRQ
jgi:hypothetical protein